MQILLWKGNLDFRFPKTPVNRLVEFTYLEHLPRKKVLFGFPGAGGSINDQVVHYIDSEKPDGKRIPIRNFIRACKEGGDVIRKLGYRTY